MNNLWRRLRKSVSILATISLIITMIPILSLQVSAATPASVRVTSSVSPAVIYPNQTATVNLNVTGKQGTYEINETSRIIPTDIILVIDQSGSMSGRNMSALKPAAVNFVKKIDFTKHRIAIVGYSDVIETSTGFVTDADSAIATIDSITAGGGTCIVPAINEAISIFQSAGRTDAKQNVIVLTDGQATDKDQAAAAAQSAKEKGVIFYTIGMYGTASNAEVPGTTEYTINKTLGDLATSLEHHHFIGVENLDTTLIETYEKIASNVGKDKATNVKITQIIPEGFELVSGSADNNVPRPTISGNTLTWEMHEVLDGSFGLGYKIKPKEGLAYGTYSDIGKGALSYELSDGTQKYATIAGSELTLKEAKSIEVTDMSPTSGNVGTATLVKVTANNIDYGSGFGVTVGGKASEVTFTCSTYFKFKTPTDLAAGTYDVVVTNGGGKQTLVGTYTYLPVPTPTPSVITDITPVSGPEKTETLVKVTVAGMDYTGFEVAVGGKTAEVTFKCSSYFKFKTPSDLVAGTYDIVITSNGTSRTIGSYTYNAKPTPTMVPVVLEPTSGPEKTANTVTGKVSGMNYTGFGVTVGGKAAEVNFTSSSYFKFKTPSDLVAGTYDVVITSNGVSRTIGSYTFNAKPTPTLPPIILEPTTGPEKTANTVTGKVSGMDYTGFGVTVGGKAAEVSFKCSSYFKFKTPSDLGAGTYDVVITSNGNSQKIGSYTFNAKPTPTLPPIILEPITGSEKTANTVTGKVSGMDYTGFGVTVGGKAAEVSFKCSSYFKFKTPSDLGAGTYDVVITSNGNSQKIGSYTFNAKPTPTEVPIKLDPTSGPEKTANTVTATVSGMDYTGFGVTVGGKTAEVNFTCNSYFKFKTPSDLGAGTYDVVITSNGTSRKIGDYTFNAKPTPTLPPIKDISPVSGAVSKATTVKVTVSGMNYNDGFSVFVGGQPADVSFRCSSYFKFKTPTNLLAGTYDIVVKYNTSQRVIGQYTYK